MNELKKVFFIVCLVVFLIEGTLFRFGENLPHQYAYHLQIEHQMKYGQKLTSMDEGYKNYVLENHPFETIVLGSSRVMALKKQMFKDKFYNAGIYSSKGGGSLSTIFNQIKIANKDQLKNILIGLDYWQFNPNNPWCASLKGSYSRILKNRKYSQSKSVLIRTKGILRSFLKKTYSIFTGAKKFLSDRGKLYYSLFIAEVDLNSIVKEFFRKRKHIGLGAMISGDGINPDGSLDFHPKMQGPNTEEKKDKIEKINKKPSSNFTVDFTALTYLAEIIQLGKEKKINLIFFFPPMKKEYFDKLISKEGEEKVILREINSKICLPILQSGYNCMDFSNISLFPKLNSIENKFTDITHPTNILMEEIVRILDPSRP